MFDQFVKYILGELEVIAKAPITFIIASIVVFALAYTVCAWAYSTIVVQRDAK